MFSEAQFSFLEYFQSVVGARTDHPGMEGQMFLES